MTNAYKYLRLTSERDGMVVRLAFDTGKPANAITVELLAELHHAIDAVALLSTRVLVFAGRAENFSRGADIDQIRSLGPAFRAYIDSEFELFRKVEALPFVTIAAINGTCIGNAAEFALACDFRIAAEGARFALPEVAIGFVGPAQRLIRYVGLSVAKDLLLGARILGAEDALRLGLFTRVLPAADFAAGLDAFANEFADRPPIAIRVTKEGIALAMRFAEANYAAEQDAAWMTYGTEDVAEGFAALKERRPAVFKGR